MNTVMSLTDTFIEKGKIVFPQYERFFKSDAGESSAAQAFQEILRVACPVGPHQGVLTVNFLGDCFEVIFSLPGIKEPAQRRIFSFRPGETALVDETIAWLSDFFARRIVVIVERYQFLWFEPYCLAFFRDISKPFGKRAVRVVSWKREGE